MKQPGLSSVLSDDQINSSVSIIITKRATPLLAIHQDAAFLTWCC